MTSEEAKRLARTLKRRREGLGLSASEVARRAGVRNSTVTRIELAQILSPRAENLKAIAGVLELPVSDLFAAADWVPKGELPSFQPYLRAKYGDLPDTAVAELERSFTQLAERYGYDPAGPAPGEDEADRPEPRKEAR